MVRRVPVPPPRKPEQLDQRRWLDLEAAVLWSMILVTALAISMLVLFAS